MTDSVSKKKMLKATDEVTQSGALAFKCASTQTHTKQHKRRDRCSSNMLTQHTCPWLGGLRSKGVVCITHTGGFLIKYFFMWLWQIRLRAIRIRIQTGLRRACWGALSSQIPSCKKASSLTHRMPKGGETTGWSQGDETSQPAGSSSNSGRKQLHSFRKTEARRPYWVQESQAARSAEPLGQAHLLESCLWGSDQLT